MGMNFGGDGSPDFYSPKRFEADIHDCEVFGEIPKEVDGTFFRSCADRLYPKRLEKDITYNADGAVDQFRIRDGHVDFRTRYIRTERYVNEKKARRGLIGLYRNRHTMDPEFTGMSINSANTTPMVHAGKLLSMKEDSPPFWIDPHTLQSKGEFRFPDENGVDQMTAAAFTAHPKIDPVTGEMIAFSYCASGDLTKDIIFYWINPEGYITKKVQIESPVCCMMHDFAITQKHIVLNTTGMIQFEDRLKAGEIPYAYDKTVPTYVAILPRDGGAEDVRWFEGPADTSMMVHTINAVTEGDKVILDAPVSRGCFNPQFANRDGSPYDHECRKSTIQRWTFDLGSDDTTWKTEVLFGGTQASPFFRMDDRFISLPFRYAYGAVKDDGFPIEETAGELYKANLLNAWVIYDYKTGDMHKWHCGDSHCLNEPHFVPRSKDAPEGDGFIMGVRDNYAGMHSELIILDTKKFDEGPVAIVKMPFRLHTQIHGWWASNWDLPFEFGDGE